MPPALAPEVTLSLRGKRWSSSVRPANRGGAHVWNETWVCPCADPSAVLHLGLRNASLSSSDHVVGQWIVTAKMLAVAPTNVYGRDLRHESAGGAHALEGDMVLRNAEWLLLGDGKTTVRLKISYYRDDDLDYAQILGDRQTALEQLNENSLETTQRMGNLTYLRHMLEDFPVLFDVRRCEISRINFFLKDLFAGKTSSTTAAAVPRGRVDRSRAALRGARPRRSTRRRRSGPRRGRSATTSGSRSSTCGATSGRPSARPRASTSRYRPVSTPREIWPNL